MRTDPTLTDLGWNYLQETANVAVLELTRDGTILRANAYAESLTGRALTGLSASDIVVDFDRTALPSRWWEVTSEPRLTNVVTGAGLPQTLYVTVTEIEGGLLWFGQTDGAEQEYLRGELLALNRELGQLSRELELKNAQLARLDALKNQFLGMAAHDLRNPVHLILSYAELMDEDAEPPLPAPYRPYVDAIIRSTERMAGLIDVFLDVSLIDAGRFPLELAYLDVPRLIESALQSIAPTALKRDVTMGTAVADNLPRVAGDEPKLVQVLINLLSNAIEHSPIGGQVVVACAREGEALFFSVCDTGEGMDRTERDQLFRAFSGSLNRKSDGSRSIGLGLMIAQKIVAAHGGGLRVESEKGHGSTFGFTVPDSGMGTPSGGDRPRSVST